MREKSATVTRQRIYTFLTKIIVFPAVGAKPKSHFLAQGFLEIRLSTKSLEPLIEFLAYLELKSWLKNQKLDEH